jgi:hypothetical protein
MAEQPMLVPNETLLTVPRGESCCGAPKGSIYATLEPAGGTAAPLEQPPDPTPFLESHSRCRKSPNRG